MAWTCARWNLRDLTGVEKLDKLKLPEGPIAGLTADSAGNLYTAVGDSPCQLYSVNLQQRHPEVTPLKLPEPMAVIRFHWSRTCRCECVTANDKPRTLYYRLDGGHAVALDKPPDFDLAVDFSRDPSITVTMPEARCCRHIAMEFKKATWTAVKALTVGPDGRRIYGSGGTRSDLGIRSRHRLAPPSRRGLCVVQHDPVWE